MSLRSSTDMVSREEASKKHVPKESNKPRKTRLTSKVAANFLPIVVLVNDIGLGQSRVPFSKVDPWPVKSETEPTSSTTSAISSLGKSDSTPTSTVTSSIGRRNASRACRTDINYFPQPENDCSSSQAAQASVTTTTRIPSRTITSTKAKRPFSTTSSSSSKKRRSRYAEPEPVGCRFCDKPFNLLELAQAHESGCLQGEGLSTHTLQEADKQADFMSLLGMCHKDVSAAAVPSDAGAKLTESAQPLNERQARSKRLAVASYFRTGMVPINSKRGMAKILDQNAGVCTNLAEQVALYDKYCKPPNRVAKESNKTWRTAISKKMKFKDGEHVHEYSFNRYESIKTMNESVIGLDSRHFKLLNKMKDSKLELTRLTDQQIAQNMSSRIVKRQVPVTVKKFKLVLVDLRHSVEGRELLAKCNRSCNSSATTSGINQGEVTTRSRVIARRRR